jgi:hypothetical protein
MRYTLGVGTISARVTEKRDEEGEIVRMIEFAHHTRENPDEHILRCDERDLKDLSAILENPSRDGTRFRVVYVEGPFIGSRINAIEPLLLDTRDPNTAGRVAGVRFQDLKTLVSVTTRFMEALRAGDRLEDWCKREGVERRRVASTEAKPERPGAPKLRLVR